MRVSSLVTLVMAGATIGCFGDDRDLEGTVCGDAQLDAGEGCDDGNTADGDGCNQRCEVETDMPVCGNGIRETGEACDDGNTTAGDGCSDTCMHEQPGEAMCGDGVVEGDEACDDGNTSSGDGCSASCAVEELQTVNLSQNASASIVTGLSRACRYQTSGGTGENHYYRVFRLEEHGVAGSFDLDSVGIGIERVSNTQAATVAVYRYLNPTIGVTLVEADMEPLATKAIEIQGDAGGTIVRVPIDAQIPAGGTFIVELSSPDHPPGGPQEGTFLYIGANSAGQDRSGYTKAPQFGCDRDAPVTTDSVGWSDMHLVITARGKAF